MRNTLLTWLLFCSIINAQYSSTDKELIRTTATRTFDSKIINSFLNSDSNEKVNAGLLSVSNSHDTAFRPEILKLDFNTHYHFILYALGQIGESKVSADYILNRIKSSEDTAKYRPELFSTLGVVADSNSLKRMLNNLTVEPGIPTAIINFNSRKVLNSKSVEYLWDALDVVNDTELSTEILYAISRLNPPQHYYSMLINLLHFNDSILPVEAKIYVLNCLRKLKSFDDRKLFERLLNHDDWRVRTEAARTLCYYNFISEAEVNNYLRLLKDKNPNVSRAAAISVKDMKVTSTLRDVIEQDILDGINKHYYTENTAGEAFISLCSFYPNKVAEYIEDVRANIKNSFINMGLKYSINNALWIFNFLLEQFKDAGEKDLLSIVPALLNLQDSLQDNEQYNKLMILLLRSDYASVISVTADGLNSPLIERNSNILQQILPEMCLKIMNNPAYIESIFSLINLSGKVSEALRITLLELLETSKLASVKSFVKSKLGKDERIIKTIDKLELMIDEAFNYNKAIVTTTKGNFIIQLLPRYAPVTVGNFIVLAKKQYFADVLFHRVVPNFVIQTGDPSGTGWGGPGYEIISEFSPLEFKRSFVGMASAGTDTEGSQWFVMHSRYPHLNGRYTIFGEVVDGMDVVDEIDEGDKIIKIELQ